MKSGKFESSVEISDQEFDVMVFWEGSDDRGDYWTPPDRWMEITKVEFVGDWPEGLSEKQFKFICDHNLDRWCDMAWDTYHDNETYRYGAEAL